MNKKYIYKCWCGDIVYTIGGCVPPNCKKLYLGKTFAKEKEIILFSAKLNKWISKEVDENKVVGFMPLERYI